MTLDKVLDCLETVRLCLKQHTQVLLPAVEYLWDNILAWKIQLTEEKVRTIKEAPLSTNVTQL